MSKASTRATAKYHAKIGLVSRTYKLKLAIVDEFKAACQISGESQSAVLMRLMDEYVKQTISSKDKSQRYKYLHSVLTKWKDNLEKATKKENLPCVYHYDYGTKEPHIYVRGEVIHIPKEDTEALIELNSVFINNPKE
jgi:hypothetical protein